MVKMEHNKKSCHADLVLNTFRSMMPGNGKTKIVTFRVVVKSEEYNVITHLLHLFML